ncbi:hypothetical protein SAMN05428949_0019 [Chitinophaga sp. YR627]|uniref:DUF4870 domain-containing protein n=1 Tax=Chitinophaga pinensis TaxID=79329 RepID=A0A5C6LPP0_9BACT|nr:MULTISPECIES: DUF4870 domain-containing protein [Chitinophaga]TWV93629.1 DUF4870 domain-containing protein [Chitinophaga pinensis]SFM57237.1 hypothetical protein SAMN05428949_0019 [Chitinophaga sp. YR627]
MTNRTMAIVAYITLIGWVVAYLSYRKSDDKSPFVQYHLSQSLGIIIFSIALSIASGILVGILPSLATLFYIISLCPFILMLLGIITASNEAQRPIPLIGKLVEGKFNL